MVQGSSQARPLRVVIDTNVVLSKYISKNGTAGKAFDHIISNCTLVMCEETLAEIAAKISEDKFLRYGSSEEVARFLAAIEAIAEFVTVRTEVQASPDPKDDIFLALAIDGRADYIVSGDKKHLLPLNPYEGIPILAPAEFLAKVGN